MSSCFLLLQPHSYALPFIFIIEISDFLIGSLKLVSLLLQNSLHPGKGRPMYLHLKTSNCEHIPAHKAQQTGHMTPKPTNSLTLFQRIRSLLPWTHSQLLFCGTDKTCPRLLDSSILVYSRERPAPSWPAAHWPARQEAGSHLVEAP